MDVNVYQVFFARPSPIAIILVICNNERTSEMIQYSFGILEEMYRNIASIL